MKNKKLIIFVSLVALNLIPLFAQDGPRFGEKEVRSSEEVEFINRSSRFASPTVIEENKKTGKGLAQKVLKGEDKPQSVDGWMILRFPADDTKFGADVIDISKDVDYGHVHSIQRTLAAYLQEYFKYKESDADILATYILYYNAVHRGDMKYIKEKYSKAVQDGVDPKKLGIARKYSDWPGKTQLLLPIVSNILAANGKDVQTEELQAQVESPKNKVAPPSPEEKQQMQNLQQNKLENEKKVLVQKKEDVKQQEIQVQKKKSDLEKQLQTLSKDPVKNKQAIQETKKQVQQVQKQEQQVQEQKQQLQKKEEQLAQTEKKIEEQKQASADSSSASSDTSGGGSNAPAQEQLQEVKQELQQTKQELQTVKEEQQKQEQFDKNVVGGRILFLKTLQYIDQGHYNNQLLVIDPTKDDMVLQSSFNKICGRTFEVYDDKALVIGFQSSHSSEHNLMLIDQTSLKPVKTSTVDVFWRTPMIIKGEDLYAFESENGKYYLSRFDKELKRTVRSSETIDPNSNVTFYGDKIYVTGKEESTNKMIVTVFKKADLTLIKKIFP